MNQTLDFIEILPIEVIIDIFMRLDIKTFETFLFYYWIGPSWRRILIKYTLPSISYKLAQNLLISNCTGNKHRVMREKISNEISMANRLNRPVSFSFSFLFFMYHVDDIIAIDYNDTRTYHGVFFRSSRTISNIILICGSSCLKTMSIRAQLAKDTFPSILRNLHNSKKIESVIIERALGYDDIPDVSSYPRNRTLHTFYIKNFQGTNEKRQRLYQFIENNFLAIRHIQIN